MVVQDLFQSFSNDSRLKGRVPSDSPSTMCKYLLFNEAIWLCYGLLRILTELLSQRFPLSPPHSEISSWVCEATRRGGYILCEYIIPCQGLHFLAFRYAPLMNRPFESFAWSCYSTVVTIMSRTTWHELRN